MISKEHAIQLLREYEDSLNQFQIIIQNNLQKLLRYNIKIIPNVISALKAISNGEEIFFPNVSSSGMSNITSLDNDPQKALNQLLER